MNKALIIPKKSKYIKILPFNTREYLVKQTYYNRQVKINLNTLEILNLVDGKRNINEIVTLINNNKYVDNNIIYNLLFNKLAKFGIIENENLVIEKQGKPNYLKLSTTLLTKNNIKPIIKFFSPLFSKSLFYPFLLLNALIVTITLFFNDNLLLDSIDNLTFFQWLVNILMTGFILFFHEFGHASSCYKYGAKFGEIGCGFYLFIPVMFADVSDIWQLKPKERVIVNLSGIYIELILGSILSILFLVTHNAEYLVLDTIILLSVITNLNPFLRYDGYWVLSDLINVPNLRKESNKIFLSLFKRNVRREYNTVNYVFLAIYGLISNILIFLVIASLFISDPYGIIHFPVNLYNYIVNLTTSAITFRLSNTFNFILPIIFYTIILKMLYSFILRILAKYN